MAHKRSPNLQRHITENMDLKIDSYNIDRYVMEEYCSFDFSLTVMNFLISEPAAYSLDERGFNWITENNQSCQVP